VTPQHPQPEHKTMRDKLKEKLNELDEKTNGFGIAHSMTIGYIIDDIERITGIVDDSWMGVPWTEFLTCEQEAEVMEGRKAIEELKRLRTPHTHARNDSATTTNDTEHRKSLQTPDGSSRAPDIGESRRIGRNCCASHSSTPARNDSNLDALAAWIKEYQSGKDSAYMEVVLLPVLEKIEQLRQQHPQEMRR